MAYRSLLLILVSAMVLVALGACQDRRSLRQQEGATLLPRSQDTPEIQTTPVPMPSGREGGEQVNRIAYVGSDGNIFTIRPDGTDSRRLTTTDLRVGPGGHIFVQAARSQVFYAWPTWSPDSTKLAVSRSSVQGNSVLFSLEVLDETTGTAARIYDNEPNTIAIATGAPHYMYWSPDSEHLAFIAATPGELALFLSTASGEGGATRLRGEGPIYMVWTLDGRALLMHQRMELLLMFLDDGSPGPLRSLVGASMGFKTPAVSPDGTRVAYVVEEDEGSSLFMGNISLAGIGAPPLSGARSVLDVGPSSAFLWSPTRDEIAVADTMDVTQSGYERLVLISGDAVSPTPVVDEPFLAFFWSPDGEKIAYIAFDSDRTTFTWKHVHRSGGGPVALAEFSPSSDFLTMMNFFDQYAYSNAFWSPDSSQIVFAGTVSPGDPRRNGGSPDEDKVYVLDVKEGSTPREIAAGRIAVWSWK